LSGTINFGKNLKNITSKILTQICAKAGGIPWTIDQMPLFDKKIMICGLDVFHETKTKCKSVVGFVSTYNRSATKYWSSTIVQPVIGQEVCTELQTLMKKALQNFKSMNGTYPERVVMFRDGVGAHQLKATCQSEVDQIHQAFAEVQAADQPAIELLFITVNKMTRMEIYAQGIYEDDSYKNTVSGTVLDFESEVTSSANEFYLVSQNMKMGMSMPSKYTIVHDSVGSTLSDVQLLCYKLCYLYFNVQGPIRVPAPIMYADKLAALVAEKNELELEDGPERQPIKIHDTFMQPHSSLFFI